jgi:hypothetical protein
MSKLDEIRRLQDRTKAFAECKELLKIFAAWLATAKANR